MASRVPLQIVPVTGPPGAGKSTALLTLERQAPRLARFGVRDYGLQLAAANHPLGLEMRDTLLRQELLSNELVRREFLHFIDAQPAGIGTVAVEGYPRDLPQCEDLLDAVRSRGAAVTAFVLLDIPDEVVRTRVARRRLCVRCGLHTDDANAPACVECGGPVDRRSDDDAARLERRLADYRLVSRAPIAYFADRDLLRTVDGLAPADRVRTALASVLRVRLDPALVDGGR